MSDLRRDFIQTRIIELDEEGAVDILNRSVRSLEEKALAQFALESIDESRVRFIRYGQFRYQNQAHSVEVVLPEGTIPTEKINQIEDSFRAEYEREYTYRLEAPVELVGFHVVALADVGKLTPKELPVTGRKTDDAVKGKRQVDYTAEGTHEAVIYDGNLLEPDMKFTGPGIIEESGSTIVVMPGMKCRVDSYGNIHIQVG